MKELFIRTNHSLADFSGGRALCFLGYESSRPPIFTMFDITRVFIKVTLIKSRSHSLGRNNNFFPRFVSNRCYTANRRKILREKARVARRIPFSACPFDFARSNRRNWNQCHFIYREALRRFSLAVSLCVTRMD